MTQRDGAQTDDGFHAQLRYAAVRDAVLGRGPNPVPGEEAAQVMALLDLGVASHQARRELELPAA